MKQILISIKPKWVAKILSGEKTLEIRKTAPKEWVGLHNGKIKKNPEPMIVYIYCTKSDYIGHISKKYVGKVVAKFTLKDVYTIYYRDTTDENDTIYTIYRIGEKIVHIWADHHPFDNSLLRDSCLLYRELNDYLKGKIGYAWKIDDLEIFDEPKKLSDFYTYRKPSYILERAPQSWLYVEENE